MCNQRILFIGGHPKGYDIPFHPSTISGRRLRKIVNSVNIYAEYLDLWTDDDDQKRGEISPEIIDQIKHKQQSDFIVVALGRYVHERTRNHGITAIYLPHPAARSKKYMDLLIAGINKLIIGKEDNSSNKE